MIPERTMDCSEAGPLLVFLACDEVTAEERAAIENHLSGCADCRALLAEEGAFQEHALTVPQAADELDHTGTLLAQCRSELAESLDEIAAPAEPEKWQPFGFVRRWMALRPGWSAAGLLTAGAILGVQLLQWLPTDNSNIRGTTMNVSAAPRISDEQLAKMGVAAISFAPSDAAPGMLQVQLRAEQPMVLSGNVDDTDMRRVLTYVVRNSERFDAGVRLDCLDALKARIHDAEIRSALLEAARRDQNPAVRMKALEALRDVASQEDVRDALLESLNRDANPGVRVEAVNLLVRSLEMESSSEAQMAPEAPEGFNSDSTVAPKASAVALSGSDPSVRRVIRALEDLQHRDPNRYVRLRSSAALRQIGPPDVQ
ncbi:MAG TPA: HEAT repeat domain-containing protein [Candidatus Acidoferrum sp.]|jgi:hypothetical protein